MKAARKPLSGVAIILVMLVLALLAVVASAVYQLGASSLYASHREEEEKRALLAAEAGLWRAAIAYRADGTFTSFPETDLPGAAARYRVEVILAPGPGPKGPIPAGLAYIHATGTSGRVGETTDLWERQVGLLVERSDSAYHYGLFASTQLEMRRGGTACWSSSAGPYPAGTRPARAHVGTNGNTPNSVVVQGSSQIDAGTGIIHMPTGAPPSGISSPGGAYLSRVDQMPSYIMPTVTMSASTTTAPNVTNFSGYLAPGTYGEVIVPSGETLSLWEGASYQFERIRLEGTGALALGNGSLPAATNPAAARTVVQVNDTLVMDSTARILNASGRADFLEFEINGVSGGTNQISGGSPGGSSEAFFVMKAPNSRVELLQGRVFGAIVASVVEVGTSSDCLVVFDLDLPGNTSSPVLPGGSGEVNLFVVSHQVF